MIEALLDTGGPIELHISFGKWPTSGTEVDDVEVMSSDGRPDVRHTNLHIRRHPRMSRKPTNIIVDDKVLASVDMVPAEEGSKTKRVSMHLPSSEEVSGSIQSSAHFSYEAKLSFQHSDMSSYECTSRNGPVGPLVEINNDDDGNACATIQDVTKPFDDMRTLKVSIQLADSNVLCIILCIVADMMNEMQISQQRQRQNAILQDLCCICTVS